MRGPASASAAARPDTSSRRLAYLDVLRTFLTVLVIAHHSAIAFGASGSWYYVVAPPQGSIAPLVLTLFAAINQAFFMSLFFAIAGYFTPGSCDAKGPGPYLRDRGLRLGIPLLAYFFVLSPCVRYLARRFEGRAPEGFVAFITTDVPETWGTGPLWFVLALLIFAAGYAALRALTRRAHERTGTHPLPENARILRFVVVIGMVAFVVRLVFPVGWQIFGLQLGHFPLYVPMFVFGIWAHGNGWLRDLGSRQANRWLAAALVAIACMPLVAVLGGVGGAGKDLFGGGPHWQALVYALWEPVVCVGISMKLVVLFRERCSAPGALLRRMARGAYAAYIVHPFLLICGTALLANLPLGALIQFVGLTAIATAASFAAGDALRRAPGLRRIL